MLILYDVIEYLQAKVNADEELPSIEVLEAYKYAHKTKTTEIQVCLIQGSEYKKYTTFEGVEAFVCPFAINVYGAQYTFERDNDETETYSAQKMSYLLAEKVAQWLDYATIRDTVTDVIGATDIKIIPGQPFDTGTVLYQSVVRVDIHTTTI